MASEAIGLDDIMATLMTMGFDFQDCQDAITCGKLTVQAAVEWILAGKPGNVASGQPTLKLGQAKAQPSSQPQSDASNPFVEQNVSALTERHDESPSASNQGNFDVTDSAIVSRSHLSDKQLQIKHDFEEKERIAARKKVQDEKKKQKSDKERILKEIQADREKQKLTKQMKTDISNTPNPAANIEPQSSSSTASSDKDEKSDADALIQVRLPSGENFRQTFPATAPLSSVWDTIYNKLNKAMLPYHGFIQPFPRREFTRNEMVHSLKDLGLTPSGSLVLKKKEADQACVEPPSEPEEELSVAQGDADHDAMEDGEANFNLREADFNLRRQDEDHDPRDDPMDEDEDEEGRPNYNWGRGFRVDEEENNNPAEQMEFAEAAQALARNPFDNNDEDHQGMFEGGPRGGGPNGPFQGFGMRLVAQGVPGDDGRHRGRRAADMAAEAASQRFARQPAVAPEPEASKSHSELKYNSPSLQDLGMLALARRITDPRTPLFSMVGLSNELLQAFLTYLKKERLLNARILHLMPSYLIKLNLDFYPYTTNELLHAARVLVNLHSISMNSCPLITDAGLQFLKGMKVLKSLSLLDCGQITDLCFSGIMELSTLQSLTLEGTKVTNAGVSAFASSGMSPHLTHLNLNRTAITHAVIPDLVKFQHLKSLCLKQNRISSLAGIESIASLESLDISQTDIVSDSILCLTRLPHLKQLCLTETQEVVGDTALSYIKDMSLTSIALPCRVNTTDVGMSYITAFRLSALDLTNYTKIGDAAMLSVGQMTSLKTLLLTNTRVTNDGMVHLAGLKNLEVLFLDKTLVSNDGITVVQNFKMLTELSLAATGITSELLKQGTLNGCTMLSKLNLSRTIVGDRGLSCLKLPHLTLLNLDCTRAHMYIDMTIQKNCPAVKHITVANLSTVPEDYEQE